MFMVEQEEKDITSDEVQEKEVRVVEPKKEKNEFGLDTAEMIQAGLQFGHKTSSGHPKMKPYLLAPRNDIHIIDLDKTKEKLKEALSFIKELVSENKVILFVGTKIQTKELTKKAAIDCNMPYISEKWSGGIVTNFETITKRITYFKDLVAKKESGEFEKYTKKEQAKFKKIIDILETKFGGIKDMAKLPDAIFILDIIKDDIAVKEARDRGIKLIALVDSNCNPSLIDYPIPANDDAVSSASYILEKVKETILKVKPKVKSEKE